MRRDSRPRLALHGWYERSASTPTPLCTGRGTRSFPGTYIRYRRATGETEQCQGEKLFGRAVRGRTNPSRSSKGEQDADTPQQPREVYECSRLLVAEGDSACSLSKRSMAMASISID